MCHADGLAAAHSGQDDDPHMAQQLPCVCVGGHSVVVLRAGGLHVLPAPLRRVHRLAKYVAEKLAKTLQVIVAIEAAHDERAAIERPGLAQCRAPVARLEQQSKNELLRRAAALDIEGRATMSKAKLVQAIEKAPAKSA